MLKTRVYVALDNFRAGKNLVGWLSGFRAQTGSVANWMYATVVSSLGEAAVLGGGSAESAPTLRRIPCNLPYN